MSRKSALAVVPATDPGLGDINAPPGSIEWAKAVRAGLQSDFSSLNFQANGLGNGLDALVETGAWRSLNRRDGSAFESLEDFCTAREPYGLGLPMAKVRAFLTLAFRGKKLGAALAPDVHATERLPLASLRRDGGTQVRAEMASATVDEYRAALDAGAAFPPVVVFFDGTDHWLADGFHRVAAHEAAGLPDVLAEVRPGTKRDALWHALSANRRHGLPMSSDDKRKAIGLMLSDPEWSTMSNRAIAAELGVSDHTVSKLRGEAATAQNAQLPERTVGKDGKARPTKRATKPTADAAPSAETPPAAPPRPAAVEAIATAPDLGALDKAYTAANGAGLTDAQADAAGKAYQARSAELRKANATTPEATAQTDLWSPSEAIDIGGAGVTVSASVDLAEGIARHATAPSEAPHPRATSAPVATLDMDIWTAALRAFGQMSKADQSLLAHAAAQLASDADRECWAQEVIGRAAERP